MLGIILHVSPNIMKSDSAKATPAKSSGDTDSYLNLLGERVRMLRHQRGMTRKA